MSVEYRKLTQKGIIKICKEVLESKPSRDNSKRKRIFDKDTLDRLEKLFNLELEVKVSHVTDVSHSGMDKYVEKCKSEEKTEINDHKPSAEILNSTVMDSQVLSDNASNASHQSPIIGKSNR